MALIFIILKTISRNKFKKSLFIWLTTQPQIRRSFDYYFIAHLWSLNSLPVYRYLNIFLLFVVLWQSELNTCWKWWRLNKHPGLKECPPQISASFKGSNIYEYPEHLASNNSIYLSLNFFKRQESGGETFFNYLEGTNNWAKESLEKKGSFLTCVSCPLHNQC